MFGGDRDLDTICAISTPPGVGGIHVIRVSGSKALSLVRKSAPFLPASIDSHRVYFGTFLWSSEPKEPIDEVLITYFQNGRSFTGEETIEISCHGSSFIASRIIQCLLRDGARVADRGEFTYRAFINGKLDLVQAESVLSLIESESKKSAEIAFQQLKGGLSQSLREIETSILALLARLEISIDFTTEDIEIISYAEIFERIQAIQKPLAKLLESFKVGRKIQSGYEVVLVGQPNVGKSSLLNRILAEERAIVTEIPGTTRDLIQEQIVIKGVKVNLTDSAGIRETEDLVERIGVDRTRGAIERADLVLAVFDSSQPRFNELFLELPQDWTNVLLVGNKIDLMNPEDQVPVKGTLRDSIREVNKFQKEVDLEAFIRERCIFVSALKADTQELLLDKITGLIDTGSFGDDAVLSNVRHFENLQRASECFLRAIDLAKEETSPEFLALEVKEGLIRVQETLGERFDDQVLDRVFKEFCIGK